MWYISPSVLWHCWLGDRKGIWPVENLHVGLLVVTIWLELCMYYSSHCHHQFRILSSNKSRLEIFWYLLTQVQLDKWPLNRREGMYTMFHKNDPLLNCPLLRQISTDFQKKFHPWIQERSCNELIIKDPSHLKGIGYPMLWNVNVRKLLIIWNKCLI